MAKSGTREKASSSNKGSQKARAKPKSQSSKVGLIFPVGRTNRIFRQGRFAERFAKDAAVFLAATLEYLTSEILELAGNACSEQGLKTIMPRHLQSAVRTDEELEKLMSSVMISSGGFTSNIHPFLTEKKKGAKKTKGI